ncbi:MAG: DEAD/DEAH box helicase [Candidatus Thalassarchaeaceae archaeon]
MVRFSDLGIEPSLIDVLAQEGIEEPFEVQKEAIPDAMLGKDICCRAPTGSGKTLAFGLPLISNTPEAESKRPTSLILTPTRELAEQIRQVLQPLARTVGLDVLSVYGGTPYKGQLRKLNQGSDILVACPGRLIDLLDRKALRLDDVGIVVLDEADRMADMGFMEPVCSIMDKCKPDRQTILFSATLDDDVKKIVDNYQTDPIQIGIGPEEVSMDSMSHFFWNVKSNRKAKLCAKVTDKCGRSIIFCRTRAGVNRLGDEMKEIGSSFTTLHGGMNQKQRDKAMKKFSSGRSRILIATDVASRGIDVTDVSCVIHFDPPDDGKVYKHRSGRTARAGSTGTVVCLVLKSQIRKYKRIQHEVGIKCRFIEPNFDRLEGREFIEAPPLKYDDDEKKPRARRNSRNNKRSRRYKKSNGYKSQKSDDKKGNGHHKKKSHHHRNKRKSKKKVTYKDKRNNKAKFNRR